ncbi:MAG: PmoA family protein [Bryobacterales bacterium]|nr:PmoA family protein [Bryobacterales bacterium]
MRRRSFLAAAVLPAMFPRAKAVADDFYWRAEEASIGLLRGEQILWQLHYGKTEAKPAFHTVALPGGPALTTYRAEDHPWHRGFWFSWKFLNGVNYWEEDKAGVAEGLTEVQRVNVKPRPDFSTQIDLAIAYHPPGKEPVLTERRRIVATAPDSEDVSRFDWTMTFTAAGEDVLIDRTPIPGEPDGKPYGGYAGLAVRLARDWSDVRIMSNHGPLAFPAEGYRGIRPREGAVDYGGVLDGRKVGFTLIDHPSNLNSPSPWWILDQGPMKYFNPVVIGAAPYTLKAGASFTLRYRGLTHFGDWDASRLALELKRFAATPPETGPAI